MMIPFYRPYFDHAELLAALRPGSGRNEFESALAARVGARYGIVFAYARTGIIASLKALGISQAEVIVPAYGCLVAAQAVIASGNKPVFVDIDLTNYNMDLNILETALTPQTRAILAIHLYGYPTNIDKIRATIGDNRIIIIEDSAQGILSSLPGMTGLRGDIGLFSFGPSKQLSTVRGGVVVTNSADLYEKIKSFRDLEASRVSPNVWAKRWIRFIASYLMFNDPVYGLLQRAGLVGWGSHASEGINPLPAEMPADYASAYADFQGRVGLAQLRKLDIVLAKRRALAEFYDRQLHDVPDLTPAPIINGATYSYYTLRIKQRDKINFSRRMLDRGINVDQTFDYFLPDLKPYRPYAQGEYPCAERAAREVVNLPIYPHLNQDKAHYVAESVRHCLHESLKS